MKTKPTQEKEIQRKWHLVDVKDQTLGRIAGEIAHLLRGKTKPYFVPNLDCGDFVVVINASKIVVTGKKETQKLYTHFSGYPGGLKTITVERLRIKKPDEIILHAVSGMLPKNKLRDLWLGRLFVFAGDKHPYEKHIKN